MQLRAYMEPLKGLGQKASKLHSGSSFEKGGILVEIVESLSEWDLPYEIRNRQ